MQTETEIQKKRIFYSLAFPILFILLIWIIWSFEFVWEIDLSHFGVFPRKTSGLIGILTSPLVHGDLKHLANNSYSFLILSWILFYFYKEIAFKVFFLTYLFSGIGLWLIGRSSLHIGASGVIYGMAFFIFLSGFIRKHLGLTALSLLVIFLYGSMVWYLFPIEEGISWEGHLAGAIVGLTLARIYRNEGPQRKKFDWEDEEDEEENFEVGVSDNSSGSGSNIPPSL